MEGLSNLLNSQMYVLGVPTNFSADSGSAAPVRWFDNVKDGLL